jgi:predicted polyphosphate/ATP-dependent NAD kinase
MDLEAIAEFVIEEMRPDWIYVLGPGSTVDRIARRMRIEKTLLGVDAVKGDGTLLGKDVDESSLLSLINKGPGKIIISPIGGQGFLFGRGNQQISPEVIRRVGTENVTVVAAKSKLEGLHPRRLLVDSGDEEIDGKLRGYTRVITGYKEEMVIKVE